MSMNWDYAELSKAASEAGGPANYVNALQKTSEKLGKRKMIPWILESFGGGAILTELYENWKCKNKKNQEEIESIKEKIINGIEEHDSPYKKEK